MHVLLGAVPGRDDRLAILLAARRSDVVGLTTLSDNQAIDGSAGKTSDEL